MYFDIEYYTKKKDNKTFDDILTKLSSHFDDSRSVVFTATRIENDLYKNSFHILFPKIVFDNPTHLLNYFNSKIQKLGNIDNDKVLDKEGNKLGNILDSSVYKHTGKSQLFRIPFTTNNKPNSELLLYSENEKLLTHDLFITLDSKKTPTYETAHKNLKSEKAKKSKTKDFGNIPFGKFSKLVESLPSKYYNDFDNWVTVLLWISQHSSNNENLPYNAYVDLAVNFSKQSDLYDSKSIKKIHKILSEDRKNPGNNFGGLIKAADPKVVKNLFKSFNPNPINSSIIVDSLNSLSTKYANQIIEDEDELVVDLKKIIFIKNFGDKTRIIILHGKEICETKFTSLKQSLQLINVKIPCMKKDKQSFIPKDMFYIFKQHLPTFQKENIVFDPTIEDSEKIFNLFRGFSAEKIEYDKKKIKNFLKHLKNVWCEGRKVDYDYLLNWIAFLLQKKKKNKTAILVTSPQGCGKNIVIEFFKKIMGETFLYYNTFADLTNNFNVKQQTGILSLLDECSSVSTSSFHNNYDILKSKITEDFMRYEKKGQDATFKKSFNNFILFSNNRNPIKLESGDRRFFILRTTKTNKKSYFDKIIEEINNNTDHIYSYFMSRDISDFSSSDIPRNIHKQNMEDYQMPTNKLFLLAMCKKLEERKFLPSKTLTFLLNKFLQNNEIAKINKKSFKSLLHSMVSPSRKKIGGQNIRGYNFTSFQSICEKKFGRTHKSVLDLCEI